MHVQLTASAVPRGRIVRPTLAEIAAIGIGIDGPGIPGNAAELEDAESGSSHPALAFGNALAVWSLLDPSYYELNGSDVATLYNVLNPGTYDYTQSTAARQAAFNSTGWNGTAPTVDYTAASTHYYENAAVGAALAGLQPFSLGIALQPASISSQTFWSIGESAGTDAHALSIRASANRWQSARFGGGVKFTGAGTADTNRHVLVFTFNGTVVNAWDNGVQFITNHNQDESVSSDTSALGVLKRSGIAEAFDGKLGEAWLYNEALDAAAVAGVTAGIVAQGYGYA